MSGWYKPLLSFIMNITAVPSVVYISVYMSISISCLVETIHSLVTDGKRSRLFCTEESDWLKHTQVNIIYKDRQSYRRQHTYQCLLLFSTTAARSSPRSLWSYSAPKLSLIILTPHILLFSWISAHTLCLELFLCKSTSEIPYNVSH